MDIMKAQIFCILVIWFVSNTLSITGVDAASLLSHCDDMEMSTQSTSGEIIHNAHAIDKIAAKTKVSNTNSHSTHHDCEHDCCDGACTCQISFGSSAAILTERTYSAHTLNATSSLARLMLTHVEPLHLLLTPPPRTFFDT